MHASDSDRANSDGGYAVAGMIKSERWVRALPE